MPFLGPTDLKKFLSNDIISGYTEDRIEQAAYELSLGSEVYRTDAKDGKIEILDARNKLVEINPGQFTLLLTKETIKIPNDKLAFISIKAKQKLKGLVNVSGFHVDPGFNGQLVFSVYNAGPAPITLQTDKPYFLIWFAKLENEAAKDEVYNEKTNHHQNQNSIPLEYIDALKRGELASPNILLQKLRENEEKLNNIKWAVGIIIGLALTLTIKTCSDTNSFKDGVDYGRKEAKIDSIVKNSLKFYPTDSLSLYKIDSVINERIKILNDKKK